MNTRIFICEECTIVFQLYSQTKKKPFCPNCGDNVAVQRYRAERTTKGSTTKIRWNDEEINMLHECLDKKMEPYQVAILTGRSVNSVIKKLKRIKSDERT